MKAAKGVICVILTKINVIFSLPCHDSAQYILGKIFHDFLNFSLHLLTFFRDILKLPIYHFT